MALIDLQRVAERRLFKRSNKMKNLTWQQFVKYKTLRLTSRKRAKDKRKEFLAQIALKTLEFRGQYKTGPLIAVGFFSGSLGLGAAARRLVENLRSIGRTVYTIDVTERFRLDRDVDWSDQRIPDIPGGAVIFCVNPNQIVTLLPDFGSDYFKSKLLIGYWWWEFEVLPNYWIMLANGFDEIWCSSQFVYGALARCITKPTVRYVPQLMSRPAANKSNSGRYAADGLFTVLAAADLKSTTARKNPEGAVRAFRAAFGDASDKRLIVKVSGAASRPDEVRKLERSIGGMRNVVLETETLSAENFSSLLSRADVFLSLHRSEGLGLIMIEAMLLGKPVVATAWSGGLDFMNHTNAGLVGYRLRNVRPGEYIEAPMGSKWAEPNIDEAAQWLIRLEKDAMLRSELVANGLETVSKLFASESAKRSFERIVSSALPERAHATPDAEPILAQRVSA